MASEKPLSQTNKVTSKKFTPIRIAGLAGIVVVLAAMAVYMLAVPGILANRYRQAAEIKHTELSMKLTRVYDSFKLGSFTDPDASVSKDEADLQVAADAIKEARASLEANGEALTSFNALPLLDWKSDYNKAKATQSAELKYIEQARAFLTDYEALVKYSEVNVAIAKDMDKINSGLESSSDDTPNAYAEKLDSYAKDLQSAIDRIKSQTPPEYLKDFHKKYVEDAVAIKTIVTDLASAVRQLDLDKITDISEKIDKLTVKAEDDSKAVVAMLQKDSSVAKDIVKLKETAGKISFNF